METLGYVMLYTPFVVILCYAYYLFYKMVGLKTTLAIFTGVTILCVWFFIAESLINS